MARLIAILVTSLAIATAAAAAPAGPYFFQSGRFSVEPVPMIDLSGTSRREVIDLHWLTWGPAGATATGQYVTNTCTPNCAAGKSTAHPAHLRLSHLVACHGGQVFDHYVVTANRGHVLLAGDFRAIGYLRGCE